MRRLDPRRSHAVLVGTSHYSFAELTDLPSVRNNLAGLLAVLTDPDLGGLPTDRCLVLTDPGDVRSTYRLLRDRARAAQDTFLVYFAGHGLPDQRNELHLCLADTDPGELSVSALPYPLLRDLFGDSPAANRILVLDCCFSGLAAPAMSGDIAAELGITGTYILTATPPTAMAMAPRGSTYTAFTGALLDLLRDGLPDGPEYLTFATLYPHLLRALTERGLPRPQQRGTGLADHLALTRNAAFAPVTTQPAPPPPPAAPPRSRRWTRRRKRTVLSAGTAIVLAAAITLAVVLAPSDHPANRGAEGPGLSSSGTSTPMTPVSCVTGTLNGAGSPTQSDGISTLIHAYEQQCSGATIHYTGSGSAAGLNNFQAGQVDFAGVDGGLTPDLQQRVTVRCPTADTAIVPLVITPIAIVYHLQGVPQLRLSPATLAGIFAGRISNWNAPQIAAENPGITLPNLAIVTEHRSDTSNLSAVVSGLLAKTNSNAWTFGTAATWPPVGVGQHDGSALADAVAATDGAIGYITADDATQRRLTTINILSGATVAGPTNTAVAAAVGATKIAGSGGRNLTLDTAYDLTDSGAYPLFVTTYEILCATGGPSALLRAFLSYASSTDGQRTLAGSGYAPLPEALRAKVAAVAAGL